MRNVKGGHLFVLGLFLVGVIGTSLITDMPVPTENADASFNHTCCLEEVQVWIPYDLTTWGAVKAQHESGGYWRTECTRTEKKRHWKFWDHSNGAPCN